MAIEIVPLTEHVGAEVKGLDLHVEQDDDTKALLRRAFRDHHLLLVRQPGATDDDQIRFARIFGEISIRYSRANENTSSLVQYVSNARPDGILGDGEIVFHMDHVFYPVPLTAIALYGIEIPPSGTATKFRNAHTLYERLPDALRQRVQGIKILHLFNYQGDHTGWQDPAQAPPDSPRAWQPLVWKNPETGEDALWLSPLSTVGFEGTTLEEGRKLIDALWEFAGSVDPDFTYTHRWQPGDLVIWDNRMLHHARQPFPSSERRTLRRSSIV
ncbi:MAG: TauD/TfdA family dioxygenase [Rhodospirillaceae bacterium]|nr:TauD/TfdA family dioxygenase [Rhodospirillaceae bacterium]